MLTLLLLLTKGQRPCLCNMLRLWTT